MGPVASVCSPRDGGRGGGEEIAKCVESGKVERSGCF